MLCVRGAKSAILDFLVGSSDGRGSESRSGSVGPSVRSPPTAGAKPTASLRRIKNDYIYIEMARINYDLVRAGRRAVARDANRIIANCFDLAGDKP